MKEMFDEKLPKYYLVKKAIVENIDNEVYDSKEPIPSGRELMELGMKPGRELGAMLSELLEYVLDDPERNTKEKLCKYVKEKIEKEK